MKGERLAVLLVGLVALSTVAVAAPAVAADRAAGAGVQDGTLTVHVTDDFGSNIQGATVTATWDGGQTAGDTKPNGKVLLAVPKNTEVTLTVDHRAYVRNNPMTVTLSSDEREVDFGVFRKATAKVKVVASGEPVENARVTLWKRGNPAARGRTSADGVFETDDPVERGEYAVVTLREGYYRNDTIVDLAGGQTTSFTVRLEEGDVTVTIRVRDDYYDPARPVKNVTVDIENVATLKSVDGSRGITLDVNTDYTISVSSPGYQSASRTVSVGEQERNVSFTINRVPELTVEADNQEVLVGNKVDLTVTNEYDQRVDNATVLVDGEAVGTTNAEGVYRVAIEEAGSHAIVAEKDGVSSGEVTVEGVSPGGDATPTASATATATASATAGATGTATSGPPDILGGPGIAVQIGVAAAGVVLAFLVVRRLL